MNFATTWKAKNFTNFISYRANSRMDRSKPLILHLYVYERERERERERENSRPITSRHVILRSPQNTVNYKAPHITTRFCYHYLETNRNLPSVMQKPIIPQYV